MGVLIPFLFPNKGVPLSTGIRVGAGGGGGRRAREELTRVTAGWREPQYSYLGFGCCLHTARQDSCPEPGGRGARAKNRNREGAPSASTTVSSCICPACGAMCRPSPLQLLASCPSSEPSGPPGPRVSTVDRLGARYAP